MKNRLENPSNLIMTLPQAVEWRTKLRENNKKLVVTNGCFDILHRGHAEYLYNAAMTGDAFMLFLNSDESVRALKGPSRPVTNESDRAYIMASLEYVDAVVIFNSVRCTELFRLVKPDIYIKGGDYNLDNMNREEREALQETGADIRFVPFIGNFSTTGILEKITKNPGDQ